uniref:Putative Pyridine nucleotide-disulphide oxidoreductase n=1 Tax=uncultured marine microorganism HF4000_APKG10H11 TaxID=455559 RepID=B3TC52_9ZZZZ|nr:putative Pyridine nucleotide-disulphide oxidoreductase [uncultured marine microorganism HF4000_APKG10H11]
MVSTVNTHKTEEIDDIIIIGSGPTGLFASFYSGMREMKTKIIEAHTELGGQPIVLYPEKYVYDMAGFPKILAKNLVKELVDQAAQFNPYICLEEQVEKLEKLENGIFKLITNKNIHYTKTVLITGGIGAVVPKKLNIEDLERFEGKGVDYLVRDKEIFRDKKVLIIGGGDSAADWAIEFSKISKELTLIHRRDIFRAHENSISKIYESDINIKLFTELKGITGEDKITKVKLINNKTQIEEEIEIDLILVQVGYKAILGPIKEWGLEMKGRSVIVNNKMETNIEGVYAAGDIALDDFNLNLLVTCVSQGAIAVNWIKNRIDPKSRVLPGHSSEKGLPQKKIN